jgi:hypothetical protein
LREIMAARDMGHATWAKGQVNPSDPIRTSLRLFWRLDALV